ncbi:hypothetical protein GCM10027578_20460 [Spirosoma luteolum]
MACIRIALLLILPIGLCRAQVSFDRLPADRQLFARSARNDAAVVVSGRVTRPGYTRIGLQLWRENKLLSVSNQALSTTSALQSFSLTATIRAERAEYACRVFLYRATDSTLLANRQRLLCGDVYLLYGQSNAIPGAGLADFYTTTFDDRYLRTVTYAYGTTDIPGTMAWYAAKEPFGAVGTFGLNLQRLILDTYGIPTAIINGAIGGATITELSARDAANHAALTTAYGRLLFRAQWAGVARSLKAIIWKQGEAEAGGMAPGYASKFAALYKQLREDYGNARLYVGQINLLKSGSDSAGALRDFQRRTRQVFANVEAVATAGARGYDGVHYADPGNRQLAAEQFRLLARDIYGSADTAQINSPDVKKGIYNARRDSVQLVFDEGQQLVWRDTAYYSFATGQKLGSRELRNLFYLDGKGGQVVAGGATGNRVWLALGKPSAARRLTYTPPYFSDALSPFYNGTWLQNKRGMRAFTFSDVPIADLLPAPVLVATGVSDKLIRLNWTPVATSGTQYLERAVGAAGAFTRLATLSATADTYTDISLPDLLGVYRYRIRVESSLSESPYSNVAQARPLVLALEPDPLPDLQLYPNPVGPERQLQITLTAGYITSLTLYDAQGRPCGWWPSVRQGRAVLDMQTLAPGIYLLSAEAGAGRQIRQRVVVP